MQMFNNINDMYVNMCKDLILTGKRVNDTLELNNYMVTLTNVDQCVINVRSLSLNYMAAELLWYLNGRNDVDFIGKYASMWNRITDDGKTNNSAYGYIIKYKHGFDQLEKIIELLKVDPYSRRAVININVPNENVIKTKDEMCTICLNFQLRNSKLNCTAVMRSNDIYTGTVYDITYFILLQKYVASRLNVSCGDYTHIALSLHVYDKHIEKISNIVNSTKVDDVIVNIDSDKLFATCSNLLDEVILNNIKPIDVFFKHNIYQKLN